MLMDIYTIDVRITNWPHIKQFQTNNDMKSIKNRSEYLKLWQNFYNQNITVRTHPRRPYTSPPELMDNVKWSMQYAFRCLFC